MALIARSDIPSASPRHTAHIDLLTNRCGPCPRNRTKYAYYDGFDKVATSYEEHYGAVNTSTSLNVQYTYDTTSTGSVYSNQLRLLTDVHPNGRTIYYDYGPSSSSTAAYSATSTVREIWDGSPSGTGLAVYDYNGAGNRLAIATYPQPSFKLDHFEGTSGTYAGFDRFGRTIDQYWAGFGGTSDVDRIHYAYDYAGNRIYRQIDPAIYPTDKMDQAYTSDALSRLLTSQVGTLSGTTIGGTPVSQESWTLDGLGNWAGYATQTSGTVNLNQTRTASPANEISGISASVGSTWATPAYDLAGNMTTIPIAANLTSGYTAVYDAWNRLVSLANGTTTVAKYSYDGLNRRIVKHIYVSGTLDHNEHAYHNDQWQVLEVRKEVSGTINTNPLEQYVWHPFYLDAVVLRDYDAATSGSPTRYYYTFDANYNVTAATSAAGLVNERDYYSPYGTLTFLDASFNVLAMQQSQIGNSITYAGRQCDPESGLNYYRHRYFHPSLGQFCGRDPIEYPDGDLNLYEYTSSHPTISTDPFGTNQWLSCCGTDVTHQLYSLVKNFQTNFKAASHEKRIAACNGMVSSNGWDIYKLAFQKRDFINLPCGANGCYGTVTLSGRRCFPSADVNYTLWGLGNRLCCNETNCSTGWLGDKYSLSWAVRVVWYWRIFTGLGSAAPARAAWTKAGYRLLLSTPGPEYEDNLCGPCSKKYIGDLRGRIANSPNTIWGIGD